MSLYVEAAQIIEANAIGSKTLKELTYRAKDLKSPPAALFALLSESSLWSEVLSDVIRQSGLLDIERKLTPALAVVLSHDLLLSKKGLATNKSHPLYVTITKHKARLSAELTKVRIKRGFGSLDALRASLRQPDDPDLNASSNAFRPRWLRINTLKTSASTLLKESFTGFGTAQSLDELRDGSKKRVYRDQHVPDLYAVHPSIDITKWRSYAEGHIILQDKASCFPAYLLDPSSVDGHVIDGCAAPGNKTTHLAAILYEKATANSSYPDEIDLRVTACERANDRAEILKTMVRKAGADKLVNVRAGQDFLKLKPASNEWSDVTAILLDPSCSGSGIVGRDDGEGSDSTQKPFNPTLPPPAGQQHTEGQAKGKKRKRVNPQTPIVNVGKEPRSVAKKPQAEVLEEDAIDDNSGAGEMTAEVKERLRALSVFQSKLLIHALRFPNCTRITYSTCSIHAEENENVVIKALSSDVARERDWRIIKRNEQVDGMKRWERRGDLAAVEAEIRRSRSAAGEAQVESHAEEIADACIRCVKGTNEGTMGFFVAGFVRHEVDSEDGGDAVAAAPADDELEWEGFSD